MMLLKNLLGNRGSFIIGVSGGPDSLCLLSLLVKEKKYELLAAYFNHQLRAEADFEVSFVKSQAQKFGLPFESGSGDVRAYARAAGLSIEESARKLRYQFLFATARKFHADGVVVGHNADDQVETVLLHFLRGAGWNGLRGMSEKTILPEFDQEIPLYRPLLYTKRKEIESYCEDEGLRPLQDSTNNNEEFYRNRIRLSLIPELEKYNPEIKSALLRMAKSLDGDKQILDAALDKVWNSLAINQGNGWVSFERGAIAGLAKPVLHHVFRRAGRIILPQYTDFDYASHDRLAKFVLSEHHGQIDFVGGLVLYIEGDAIYIATRDAALPEAHWPQIRESIAISNGENDLGNNWILSCREEIIGPSTDDALGKISDIDNEGLKTKDRWSACLDADCIREQMIARCNKVGDQFTPLGIPGKSIRITEYFIERKIPRRARKNWPVICSGHQIVWIPGCQISHLFRVTALTRKIVFLHLEKN